MKFYLVMFIFINSLFGQNIESLVGKKYEDLILKQENCPIKKVPISKYKKWLGYVQFKNSVIVAVSSAKYTFTYAMQNKKNNIHRIYMTDYNTGKIIEAKKASYVFGSRIMSIGGDDIIPFEKKEDAMTFFKKEGGKKIFGIERMTENFINYLELK